ncbi:hypothetical protein LOAG_04817 [Loa loa]|uniref:Uncharacterized protein n=1 Tax=Loa loa TaxID=7209 RepID=A0A1I7VTB2_LOALO|nr:hypothetical protein LOAG_04817 [Loa loa]EFO23664.1 hypothetical protein LOAG_04817 [Loa loa]
MYRSYLPRSRRQKVVSDAVPKKRLDESAMEANTAESQLQSAPEKELKALSKGESQLISEKNLQPIPGGEPQLSLFTKDQKPVSYPSTNSRNNDQGREKH